jgi:hypothetical protein
MKVDDIGTEHLLLGIAQVPARDASEILLNLGITPGQVRVAIFEQLTPPRP